MVGEPRTKNLIRASKKQAAGSAMRRATWNLLGQRSTARRSRTLRCRRQIPLTLQWDENFDVGADTLTGVDDKGYQPPFKFTGKLHKLTLTIDRPKLMPEDIRLLEMAMHKNKASE